ncbi:hypothetical protein ACJMK2_031141 [Sinanodonta woodiana]|uniref:Mitochondria-eating protein n=1 Tax=Sinanodonta woodiana TaxID=1069815 RepID=A0ABD3X1E2_SINWO
MEATETPSYIVLVKSTNLGIYSQDKLNKINAEFMKDHEKLKGIVDFSTYFFGTYIHMIRSKKWTEAEKHRKGAQDECEKLVQFLVINGLRSDHQQKQDSQYLDYAHIFQSSTVSVQRQTPLESNTRKPQQQKQRQSQEQNSKLQHNKNIVKMNSRTAQTTLVPNSNGNASKALAKLANLPVKNPDSLVLNKDKKSRINAKKPKGESKEDMSKAQQIPENAMTTKLSANTEIVPHSANNVAKITSTKRVQHSNNHQENTQGHLHHIEIGMLDATISIADECEIMRRSEEASLILKQGNPNIADLSDSNRPTKLAERYSELYSNEYTDAFEELTTKQISERDIIQLLFIIVTNAYIYCQGKAKDESTRIKNEVQIDFMKQGYGSENAETIWKAQVAQHLKQRGLIIKDNICQNFIGEELPTFLRPQLLPMGNKLSAYASSSVEIVWWMCVQDPPLCMKWTDNKNTKEEFDTSLYRFYTKSGRYVDYCVWPVLHLYDGGPVLTKGIAEGK